STGFSVSKYFLKGTSSTQISICNSAETPQPTALTISSLVMFRHDIGLTNTKKPLIIKGFSTRKSQPIKN
ncbi:hypothetical protein ABTP92_16980, partial [Acinetobacter baumannii]